jgi:hypothetical protein
MKRILGLLVAALAVAGTAGPASAGTATFGGTLTLSLGDLPEAPYQGVGVATVNGGPNLVTPPPPGGVGTVGAHMTRIEIGASVWTGADAIPVTDPVGIAANGITEIRLTLTNNAGSLGWTSPTPSNGGGALTANTLGLAGGLARLCLVFGGPGCVLNLPLNLGSTHTAGTANVGFGVGGQQTIGGSGILRISVDHAPWTVFTASALDQPDAGGTTDCFPTKAPVTSQCVVETAQGTRHGPASASSTVNLGTVSSPAIVQFVTPGQVTTNITATSSQRLQLLSRMRFKMVPEPGLLLLLGTGVAGLAVLGRRRMRK